MADDCDGSDGEIEVKQMLRKKRPEASYMPIIYNRESDGDEIGESQLSPCGEHRSQARDEALIDELLKNDNDQKSRHDFTESCMLNADIEFDDEDEDMSKIVELPQLPESH